MIDEESVHGLILRSAELRGERQFDKAIDLILKNIGNIPHELRQNAWFEVFYAADEKGDIEKCRRFALEIAKEEPDFPSIQKYLP